MFSCVYCEIFKNSFFYRRLLVAAFDFSSSSKRTSERRVYTKCLTDLEEAVRRCSTKQVFLKISQNSQETPVQEQFLNNVPGLKTCVFIMKRHQHRCLSVNFAKFQPRFYLLITLFLVCSFIIFFQFIAAIIVVRAAI